MPSDVIGVNPAHLLHMFSKTTSFLVIYFGGFLCNSRGSQLTTPLILHYLVLLRWMFLC